MLRWASFSGLNEPGPAICSTDKPGSTLPSGGTFGAGNFLSGLVEDLAIHSAALRTGSILGSNAVRVARALSRLPSPLYGTYRHRKSALYRTFFLNSFSRLRTISLSGGAVRNFRTSLSLCCKNVVVSVSKSRPNRSIYPE
jgi:hypothetical protein